MRFGPLVLALAATLALAGPAAAESAPLKPFAVLYKPGPSWKAGAPMSQQGLGPHARYIGELQREGRIYAAGPLGAEKGLAIVGATSLDEAKAILARDPAITSGIFTAELEPFGPRFGGKVPIPLAD
ncbi:MAG TPA: YciI family protein [Phenylobacterium sp.]|nr:YciI family protein [Phenylobacterium sp.]